MLGWRLWYGWHVPGRVASLVCEKFWETEGIKLEGRYVQWCGKRGCRSKELDVSATQGVLGELAGDGGGEKWVDVVEFWVSQPEKLMT